MPADLRLPVSICRAQDTRVRLASACAVSAAAADMRRLCDAWKAFWRAQGGAGRLEDEGKAEVGGACCGFCFSTFRGFCDAQ